MKNIKDIYRKIARIIHPDLTTDQTEKYRRHNAMSAVNQAYSDENENELKRILQKLNSPELSEINLSRDTTNFESISLSGRGFVKEELKFSFVHYPSHYGVFIAFSQDSSSIPFLCSCSQQAVENFLNLKKNFPSRYWRKPDYDDSKFPGLLVSNSSEFKLKFFEKICHKCCTNIQIKENSNEPSLFVPKIAVPSLKWCGPNYYSKFVQQFGWYVHLNYLRLGICDPYGAADENFPFLSDICPMDLQEDILEIRKGLKKQRFLIRKIENITRVEFGFKESKR